MLWKIKGAHRDTGEEKTLVVEADTKEAAEKKASANGFLVASIKGVDAASTPRPEAKPPQAPAAAEGGIRVWMWLGICLGVAALSVTLTLTALYVIRSGQESPEGVAKVDASPSASLPAQAPAAATATNESPPAPRAAAPSPVNTPAEIYTKASPSVVLIRVYDKIGESGLGSGFFISEDGLIVTNHHVIKDAHRLRVVLSNGATFDDVMVAVSDPLNDLAMLKVPGTGLPSLKLATTAAAVGDRVFAIGSPSGLANTLSEGIVSGIRDDSTFGHSMVQTTAAISPGSSGGPLLNGSGAVVGVATMLLRGGQNLNFAVPVGLVTEMRDRQRVTLETTGPERAYTRLPGNLLEVSARKDPIFSPAEHWALGKLDTLKVVVEEIPLELVRQGITGDRLKTAVELRLRRAGIKVVDRSVPGYFYVKVDGVPINSSQMSYVAQVGLISASTTLADPESAGMATVWQRINGGWAGTLRMSTISDSVNDMTDRFVNDWLKARADAK